MKESILVIGSNGQIGTELVADLRVIYGPQNVVATDIREPGYEMLNAGPFEISNVLDKQNLQAIFEKYKPTQIYLLAAMLSATGEQKPKMAWELNMDGLINVLDFALTYQTKKVYWPSSIAVFGSMTVYCGVLFLGEFGQNTAIELGQYTFLVW